MFSGENSVFRDFSPVKLSVIFLFYQIPVFKLGLGAGERLFQQALP
jgi:hypothetical protein